MKSEPARSRSFPQGVATWLMTWLHAWLILMRRVSRGNRYCSEIRSFASQEKAYNFFRQIHANISHSLAYTRDMTCIQYHPSVVSQNRGIFSIPASEISHRKIGFLAISRRRAPL